MASLQLLMFSIVLLSGLTDAWFGRRNRLPAGAQLGDTCNPRWRALCGNRTLLNENVTTLTADDGFDGPNVCKRTEMYMQQTFGYTYQQFCHGRFFCEVGCFRTDECNGTMLNYTERSVGCCDGFAQGEVMGSEVAGDHFGFRRRRKSSLRRNGCPVMLRDNLMDCLLELNLDELLAQIIEVPGLVDRLSSSDADPVTVFAPSNDALINLDDISRALFLGALNRETTLSAHIGDESVPKKRLSHGRFINTLAPNVTVHIGKTRNGTAKLFYVNGVRISQPNACQARNGIVHVIDDVIGFSSATIEDILTEQSSRFSTFKQLVNGAGAISELLDVPQKSRTVFAPTNEAFNELPSGIVECLLRPENSYYLHDLVLLHISFPAEYISTLSQRRFVPTFTFWHLVVTADNDQVNITRDQIPIEDADIDARNGVIHAIPRVILPSKLSKLQRLCPATTMAPMTDPPTAVVVDPEATDGPDVIPPGGTDVLGTQPPEPPEVVGGL